MELYDLFDHVVFDYEAKIPPVTKPLSTIVENNWQFFFTYNKSTVNLETINTPRHRGDSSKVMEKELIAFIKVRLEKLLESIVDLKCRTDLHKINTYVEGIICPIISKNAPIILRFEYIDAGHEDEDGEFHIQETLQDVIGRYDWDTEDITSEGLENPYMVLKNATTMKDLLLDPHPISYRAVYCWVSDTGVERTYYPTYAFMAIKDAIKELNTLRIWELVSAYQDPIALIPRGSPQEFIDWVESRMVNIKDSYDFLSEKVMEELQTADDNNPDLTLSEIIASIPDKDFGLTPFAKSAIIKGSSYIWRLVKPQSTATWLQ